jgi:hypothetical protein
LVVAALEGLAGSSTSSIRPNPLLLLVLLFPASADDTAREDATPA